MNQIDGIDLSNYDGPLMNWELEAYRADGIAHIALRAGTESLHHVELAHQQVRACEQGGMGWSLYLWPYFDEHPVQAAGEVLVHYSHIDPPICWVDCEELTHEGTPDHNRWWLRAYTDTLIQAGHQVGIYTRKDWWETHMATDQFANLPLWVALWDWVPDLTVWRPFGGWTQLAGKQWTGNAQGPLVGGQAIDRDVFDAAVVSVAEEDDMALVAELERIAEEEVIRNIEKALAVPRLPKAAREALQFGALPAAQTIARGGAPRE